MFKNGSIGSVMHQQTTISKKDGKLKPQKLYNFENEIDENSGMTKFRFGRNQFR